MLNITAITEPRDRRELWASISPSERARLLTWFADVMQTPGAVVAQTCIQGPIVIDRTEFPLPSWHA